MRRTGLVMLAAGLAGFLLEPVVRTAAHARAWEDARWMFLGLAVMGVFFTIFPGKRG